MSFIVPKGFEHSPRGTRDNMVPSMKTNIEAGIVTVIPEEAKALMYQDLPDATVAKWVAVLRPQSLGVYWSTTTFATWRYIPTTNVVCLKDAPSSVAAVDWLLSSVKATDNHKIDNITRREVGHSAFLSQPEWTAEMLREAAGERIA
ncbi:hypothetical protein MMC14_000803 [Varicellaria rhodocarpa]|nr:hypothetical protein [Varicellaria rhodocarpa]